MMVKRKKGKYVYIEIMRILACYFVIFNHTSNRGFFLFSQKPMGSLSFWCELFLSIFCKFSVPLFLAISGALLIPKEGEGVRELYRKRILPKVCTLVFFSALFYVRAIAYGEESFNLGVFFRNVYSKKQHFSLWYLYTYISFLMVLPLLRTMIRHMEDKQFYYSFGLFILFNALLPVLEYLFSRGQYHLIGDFRKDWFCANILIYPMVGYFMQYRIKNLRKKGRIICLLWIANILTILISCCLTYVKAKETGVCTEADSQHFHETFVFVNVCTIFLTTKYLYLKYGNCLSEWFREKIITIGACTFGIYLWHMLIWEAMNRGDSPLSIANIQKALDINDMVVTLLVCAGIFVACFLITWFMKKIPLIRKLV